MKKMNSKIGPIVSLDLTEEARRLDNIRTAKTLAEAALVCGKVYQQTQNEEILETGRNLYQQAKAWQARIN